MTDDTRHTRRDRADDTSIRTHPLVRPVMCILLVMMVSLLLGCTPKTGGPQAVNYHKGSSSLTMEFLPNAPPQKLYAPNPGEQMGFPIGVRIANRGASDITSGYLSLAVERDYVQIDGWDLSDQNLQSAGSPEKATFMLNAKSAMSPDGDEFVGLASLKALPIDAQTEQHTTTVLVTACYGYHTEASADICINTNLFGLKPVQSVCSPGTISMSEGQGGPVGVTSIDERILPQGDRFVRPQFVIHLSNIGGGSVLSKDRASEACSGLPLDVSAYNLVTLDDVAFSSFSMAAGSIVCEPNPIRLRDGAAAVTCTLAEGLIPTSQDSFKTSLSVKLSYGYTKSISKALELERLPSS